MNQSQHGLIRPWIIKKISHVSCRSLCFSSTSLAVSHPPSVTSSVLSRSSVDTLRTENPPARPQNFVSFLVDIPRSPDPYILPIYVGIDFRETLNRKNQNVWRKRYEKKESFGSFVVKVTVISKVLLLSFNIALIISFTSQLILS